MTEPLGGLEFADLWNLDFHCSFMFEVDLHRAEDHLPEELEAVEVAPGLALMSVIHAHYTPDNQGGPEPFDELVCSIIVHPDLSLDMPTPRTTLGVLDVWSNSRGFVDYKVDALGMPVHHRASIRSEIAPDRRSTKVWDDDGPILELGLGELEPKYRDEDFCGQYFAQPAASLNHGPWRWTGRMTGHQRPRMARARLYEHPFFPSGLLGSRTPRCNMQQMSEPGAVVNMRTYAYRQLG